MSAPLKMSLGITNVDLMGITTNQIVHDLNKPFDYAENLDLVLDLMHKLNRFNGTINFSVLQHTLLGVEIIRRNIPNNSKEYKNIIKSWLLHDMHEIILNDIPSPVKALIRQISDSTETSLDKIERLLHEDVLKSFNFENYEKSKVKDIDNYCYQVETKYFKKEVNESDIDMEFIGEHVWFLMNTTVNELKYTFMKHLALAG